MSEKKANILPDLKRWMTNIATDLQDTPVSDLAIPGSHDSGSYALDIAQGISPDRPELRDSPWVKTFGCIALPVIKRWTQTQALDISAQLNGGIRYLDMRMTSRPDDTHYYYAHTIYGPTNYDVLNQVKAFLAENPREVVFIDYQHFYSFTTDDHIKLINQIIDVLGDSMVPYSADMEYTLRHLWHNKWNVFVYYRDDSAQNQSPLLWPSRSLPNPWADTMDGKELIKFLDDNQKTRPEKSGYVSQAVLTPTNQHVVSHFYTSLETDLAQTCNQTISSWLDRQSGVSKGPNIVITDFIEWKDYELPVKTIGLNDKNSCSRTSVEISV